MGSRKRKDNFLAIGDGKDKNYLTAINVLLRLKGSVILHAERPYVLKALRIFVKAKEMFKPRIIYYNFNEDNGNFMVMLKSKNKPIEKDYVIS